MSYTLVLEPTAAAWRGGQRLVLQVDGERIADVEYRPAAEDQRRVVRPIDVVPAIRQAGRRCTSCGFAHALAACQAFEALLGLEATPRAAYLRCVAAELERAAAHLAILGDLFAALGLGHDAALLAALHADARAALLRVAGPTSGELLLPGGLAHDLAEEARAELRQVIVRLSRQLFQLADRTIDRRLLLARTVEVAALNRAASLQFGLRGPLARAAGIAEDVRVDRPYAAYAALAPALITQEGGDLYARLVVLLLEALEAVKLVDRALAELPAGPWQGADPRQLPAGTAEAEVEAPRGGLRYRVESDGARLGSIAVDLAPQLDRLLARALLVQARLDDAALIALSANPCSDCAATTGG